jgi:hypothetical protein
MRSHRRPPVAADRPVRRVEVAGQEESSAHAGQTLVHARDLIDWRVDGFRLVAGHAAAGSRPAHQGGAVGRSV